MYWVQVTIMTFTKFLSIILASALNYWQNPFSDALEQTRVKFTSFTMGSCRFNL
jgi:hypothetical protein